MRTRLPLLAALTVAALAPAFPPAAVRAALPPLIPREILFGNPEKVAPQLSSDGSQLAYLAPDEKNVLQVWVQTVGQSDAHSVTKDPKRGIRRFMWAPGGASILYMQDNDGDENFHVYQTNPATKDTRDLTPFVGARAELLAAETDHPDEILVLANRRNKALFDVFRVNLATGAIAVEAENPGGVGEWIADLDLHVRARTSQKPDGSSDLEVRDAAGGEWRKVLTWTPADEVSPLAMSQDGKSLYLESDLDANADRLVAMDLATGQTTVVSEDPGADVGTVAMHPKTNAVQAVAYTKARRNWVVLDKTVARDFALIPKLSDGDFNIVSRTADDTRWIVGFTRDHGAVRYYAWDRAAAKGTFLFAHQPKLETVTLASMEPVVITTRDGLKLQCYLTKPAGVPAKGLPLVLNVHGGPWARDTWGFNPEAQWLANRGYACLQVNYRGSSGFGKKFLHAADHEFAGKMHDDLIDAVNWAVKSGLADPKHIAIYGGSYGGYATLVGLTFTPDVFACGIDLCGPSNLVSLVESFPPYWKPFMASSWFPRVGDPNKPEERKDMEARSPLFKADQITRPLMVIQGANDPRVTQKESDRIVEAARKSGKEVQYYVFPDEGHGLARPENRLKFYAHAEQFLAKYLGGRAEPISDEMKMQTSSVDAPSGNGTATK